MQVTLTLCETTVSVAIALATSPRQPLLFTTLRTFPITNINPYANLVRLHFPFSRSPNYESLRKHYSTREPPGRKASKRTSPRPIPQRKLAKQTVKDKRTTKVDEKDNTSTPFRKITPHWPRRVVSFNAQHHEPRRLRRLPIRNGFSRGVKFQTRVQDKIKSTGLVKILVQSKSLASKLLRLGLSYLKREHPPTGKQLGDLRPPRRRRPGKPRSIRDKSADTTDRQSWVTKIWSKAKAALFPPAGLLNSTDAEHKKKPSESQVKSSSGSGITIAKEIRHRAAARFIEHPMRFYFKVITTPSADTPGTTILLHFDNKRYIFGQIAEGTQRACVERGISLLNVRHIFLTGQTGWQTIGGLFGLILTLADSHAARALSNPDLSKPTLHIAGGPNLQHTLATARQFIFRKSLPLSVSEWEQGKEAFSEEPTWSDENIQVWALKLKQKIKLEGNGGTRDDPSLSSGETARSIQERQLRQEVVDQMFNSDWSLDQLDEVPLSEVKLPAALYVRNPHTKGLEPYDGPLPDDQGNAPNINVLVRRPWPSSMVKGLPRAKKSTEALAYIIKSHPARGKFLPAKAKLLGVAAGPLFSKLANGASVQAADGSWVHPDMVLDKAIPGSGLAIIDLTSGDFEDDLCDRPEWSSHNVMNGVEAIIWLLKSTPTKTDKLNELARRFPTMQHYYSSASACPNSISFESAASSSIRLASLAPDHFAIPLYQNQPTRDLHHQNPDGSVSRRLSLIEQRPVERGLIVQIRPTYRLLRNEIPPVFDPLEFSRSIGLEISDLVARRSTKGDDSDAGEDQQRSEADVPGMDAELFTLGTGSALPSKYRNVSATLLRVPGHGSYLFDCGEGTLGQLKRMFSVDELQAILIDLKMIWISHLHADHHLGLVNVLKSYNAARESVSRAAKEHGFSSTDRRRLIVASDGDLFKMLGEYASTGDLSLDRVLLLSCRSRHKVDGSLGMVTKEYVPGKQLRHFDLGSHSEDSGGLNSVLFCPVSHCRNALAVSLVFPDGFKVSYSGDCRPSKHFIAIGQNSTVLIHEATFDDDKAEDAMAKKHSTIGDALGVGAAMRARRLLLTHFSQRYQKIPMMSQIKPTAVAFEDVSDTDDDSIRPLDGRSDDNGSIGIENQNEPHTSIQNTDDLDDSCRDTESLSSEQLPTGTAPQPSGGIAIRDPFSPQSDQSVELGSQFFPNSIVQDSSNSEAEKGAAAGPNAEAPDLSKADGMRIAIAFDLMRLKVRDFPEMEKLSDAISALFKSDEERSGKRDKSNVTDPGADEQSHRQKSGDRDSPRKGSGNEQHNFEQDNKRRKLAPTQDTQVTETNTHHAMGTSNLEDKTVFNLESALYETSRRIERESEIKVFTNFELMSDPRAPGPNISLTPEAFSFVRRLKELGMKSSAVMMILGSQVWAGDLLRQRLLAEAVQRDPILEWYCDMLMRMGMSPSELDSIKTDAKLSLEQLTIVLLRELRQRLKFEKDSVKIPLARENDSDGQSSALQAILDQIILTRNYKYQYLAAKDAGLTIKAKDYLEYERKAAWSLFKQWTQLDYTQSERLQKAKTTSSTISTASNILSLPSGPIFLQAQVLRRAYDMYFMTRALIKLFLKWIVLILRLQRGGMPNKTSISAVSYNCGEYPTSEKLSNLSVKGRLRIASRTICETSVSLNTSQNLVLSLLKLKAGQLVTLAQACRSRRERGLLIEISELAAQPLENKGFNAFFRHPVRIIPTLSEAILQGDYDSKQLFSTEVKIDATAWEGLMKLLSPALRSEPADQYQFSKNVWDTTERMHDLMKLSRDLAHDEMCLEPWDAAVVKAIERSQEGMEHDTQLDLQDWMPDFERLHLQSEHSLAVGLPAKSVNLEHNDPLLVQPKGQDFLRASTFNEEDVSQLCLPPQQVAAQKKDPTPGFKAEKDLDEQQPSIEMLEVALDRDQSQNTTSSTSMTINDSNPSDVDASDASASAAAAASSSSSSSSSKQRVNVQALLARKTTLQSELAKKLLNVRAGSGMEKQVQKLYEKIERVDRAVELQGLKPEEVPRAGATVAAAGVGTTLEDIQELVEHKLQNLQERVASLERVAGGGKNRRGGGGGGDGDGVEKNVG